MSDEEITRMHEVLRLRGSFVVKEADMHEMKRRGWKRVQMLKPDGSMKKLGIGWQKDNLECDTLRQAAECEARLLDNEITHSLQRCLAEIQRYRQEAMRPLTPQPPC